MTSGALPDALSDAQLRTLLRRALTRPGNLVDVPVTLAATTKDIVFTMADQDAEYGVTVIPNWLTTVMVTLKTRTGFRITFGTGAPASATVDIQTYRQE